MNRRVTTATCLLLSVASSACAGPSADVTSTATAELLGMAEVIDDLPSPIERSYEGRGNVQIDGQGFGLRARARIYDREGLLELAALEIDGDDATLRGGPFDLGSQDIRGLHAELTTPGALEAPSGARWTLTAAPSFFVRGYEARDGAGVLRRPILWETRTISDLSLAFDAEGAVHVTGSTIVSYDGDTYSVRFAAVLDLVNTSPVAFGGPVTGDPFADPFAQHATAGCPVKLPDGSPGIVEMNDPTGWDGAFVQSSWDPDGDPIVGVYWRVVSADGRLDTTSGDSMVHLVLPPDVYRSSLWVTDPRRAGGREVCTFRVADTTAPVITARPLSAECEGPSGINVGSPVVTEWLASARAVDRVSGNPPVTVDAPSGAIPLGSATVRLVATDDAGNTGHTDVSVEVRDTQPPIVWAEAWPTRVLADWQWHPVSLDAFSWDLCGATSVVLEATAASPGTYVWGATTGTLPSSVWILGGARGRVKFLFRTVDASGNAAYATAVVDVGGSP